MSALLRTLGLAVARGDRVLLDPLNFQVEPGDVLHLRGHNGAGKTTLIEVLAGLRRPAAGEVQRPAPQDLHWVGHRNALNPDLSIVENLRAWCDLQGLARIDLRPAVERMGLTRLRHRPARTLSAGQRRRAALARLLLVRRPLWMLDEPLSALDTEGLRLLGQLMNEHSDGGGGIVVTSHQSLPGRLQRLRIIELAAPSAPMGPA